MAKTQKKTASEKVAKPKVSKSALKLRKKLAKLTTKQLRIRHRSSKPNKIHRLPTPQQLSAITPLQKLNCPICLELLLCPFSTLCGHTFCLLCIQQNLRYNSRCSLCRGEVAHQDIRKDIVAQRLVQLRLRQSGKELVEEYQRRFRVFDEMEQLRKLEPSIDLGDFVDFWSDGEWQSGQIIQIYEDENLNKTLVVRYESYDLQTYHLQFPINSRMVARYRTFSSQPASQYQYSQDQDEYSYIEASSEYLEFSFSNSASNGVNSSASNGANGLASNGVNNALSNGANNEASNGINSAASSGINSAVSNVANNTARNGINSVVNAATNGVNNAVSNGLHNAVSDADNNEFSDRDSDGDNNRANFVFSNEVNNRRPTRNNLFVQVQEAQERNNELFPNILPPTPTVNWWDEVSGMSELSLQPELPY